jgi:hypothetical protein
MSTSVELQNCSIFIPGRGRLVGLNGGFASRIGEKPCSKRRSGELIRRSPTIKLYVSKSTLNSRGSFICVPASDSGDLAE